MQRDTIAVLVALSVLPFVTPAQAQLRKCSPDSVAVGPICVDKYEASVWQIPPPNTSLVKKIQKGKATLADLGKGGAVQLAAAGTAACTFTEYGADFPPNGNWTAPLYAVSVAGVLPSACESWFQAEQACRLAGKRLLTNQEWQAAAAGTPDPGADDGATDCNVITAPGPTNTGSRAKCVSRWRAFDMVGNLAEWAADWVPFSTACPGWGSFSDDLMCLSGASDSVPAPGAFIRGGNWGLGAQSGVFAVSAFGDLSAAPRLGFRCAR